MRMVLGLFSIFVVAVIAFMYKTNQLATLDREIPGVPGKKFSDLDPRKIVSEYKKTLGDVEKRNHALLNGELNADKLKEVAKASADNKKALTDLMNDMPSGADDNREASSSTSPPVAAKGKIERPTRIHRYGMELEKISAESTKPYLGNWAYVVPQTQELPVRLSLRPDGAISSIAVNMQPNINASMGDNSTPLWKNTKTGQVIALAGERDYIVLSPHASGLRGTLYRRGADGVTYQKIMEFPMQHM